MGTQDLGAMCPIGGPGFTQGAQATQVAPGLATAVDGLGPYFLKLKSGQWSDQKDVFPNLMSKT